MFSFDNEMSFTFLIFILCTATTRCQDLYYKEELLLRPSSMGGSLSATFRFTTLTDEHHHPHYRLMPRPLGELIHRHSVRELGMSLSRGVWREERLGYAPFPAPSGATVSAWFNSDVKDVDSAWYRLTNALSGQLCASLNFLDSTLTVEPEFSFQPNGLRFEHEVNRVNTTHFRTGTLPGENVCTENLTPWKKLLPCESKRGLATLLNARSVQDTSYHSLGLSARFVCKEETCDKRLLEFTQYMTLVFDLDARDKTDWSLRSLFGIGLTAPCPLAESTVILIDDRGFFKVTPETNQVRETIKVYDVKNLTDRGIQNLIANYPSKQEISSKPASTLYATRYVTGYGQEKGGIVTKIYNRGEKPVDVVFLDVVPWYLRLYFHTFRIENSVISTINPLAVRFTPGRDRERPFVLECVLRLPAQSVTLISIEFERSLLKWLEYPPDANKGFYVGSALISAILPRNGSHFQVIDGHSSSSSTFLDSLLQDDNFTVLIRIYTESLLVNLPTPDFSMPYNVICLACTVVALAFGPLHNITTKKLVVVDPTNKSWLKKTYETFAERFKKSAKQETSNEENKKDE